MSAISRRRRGKRPAGGEALHGPAPGHTGHGGQGTGAELEGSPRGVRVVLGGLGLPGTGDGVEEEGGGGLPWLPSAMATCLWGSHRTSVADALQLCTLLCGLVLCSFSAWLTGVVVL